MTVPYRFANATGTILLAELDSNFDYVSNNVSTANTVLSSSQPNITSVGTLTSLSVTGNIIGNYLIGNGTALTSIPGANVFGTVSRAAQANTANIAITANSATTAGTVTTFAQPNITSVGILTSVSTTGNVTGANLLTSGLISAVGNIKTIGNVSFGTSGNGLLYTDSLGFSVMVSGNTAAGSFISSGDQTTTVGSHPTYGVLAVTEYGTNFRALAWNGGNLDLDRFGTGKGNIGNVNNISVTGTVTTSIAKTSSVTVGDLPAAAIAGEGARSFVSDANSTTFGNLAVGGSTNKVPVYSDGTSWRIG